MNNIIINTTEINAFETLQALCSSINKPTEYISSLWDSLVENPGLMKEFIYYLEHGTILDEFKVNNISLSDLYVIEMKRYNLFISDLGKNTNGCDKSGLVLDTFSSMARLIKDPSSITDNDLGMDIY